MPSWVTSVSFIFVGIFALISQRLLLCLHTFRHTRYHSLRPLQRSIHGISYHSRHAGIICSIAQLRLSFHIPTPSFPHFCNIEFSNIAYCGPWASGSCSNLNASIRLPGQAQTWCTARLVDLRLTVRNSERIPDAIARLREHLLRTVLLGKVRRLEHFVSAADTRALWSGEGFGVAAEARGYDVTVSGRMYEFGRLRGSLVRIWDSGEGRFILESQDVLCYKENSKNTRLTFMDAICYPLILISSLIAALQNPASLLDLEVVRGEIKFRKFRDRDNALERHAMQFLGERKPEWMNAPFLHDFLWDAICQVLVGTTSEAVLEAGMVDE